MNQKNQKTFNVLIVDDSDDDRFFMKKCIERFPRFHLLRELRDGAEAIDYFSGHNDFADRKKYPLPDLMLLDLKMPRKTGFEVLDWLRSQPLPDLTVIVLSGSSLGEDIGASLALGAHGYWTKTAGKEKQDKIAREIEELLERRRTLRIPASAGKS